ncbi:MAG: aminomethyl-transferring glycine dehydrogenase subunit GcvPA [Firmicutes bacterium]|nr:aminomethyl-transferring glycine dehydrogenase subunit GcvPA [Bacillota bacterium]
MMHKYFPQTKNDQQKMLSDIGASSLDDLFQAIPESLRYKGDFDLPKSLGDFQLTKLMQEKQALNHQLKVFRGAGAFDHYIPTVVRSITSRQEFLTSYTPYQPEVAQGTLQYIFEYQSIVSELTGMDVSNASMYDGSTATAEAMYMAYGISGKSKICVSKTINDHTLDVIKTYAYFRNIEVVDIDEKDGHIDLSSIQDHLTDSMGIIVQSPNKYGIIESYSNLSQHVHDQKGLFIMNREGQSLALLKTPKDEGVDIACGDLQALGIPLSAGGPYIGYLATNQAFIRKLPGRICGMTKDVDGKRAFVLTLRAREQDIRRDKANSNICSNQSLNALAVTVYVSSLGKKGLKEVASACLNGAYHFKKMLLQTGLFDDVYPHPHFKEFTLKYKGHPNSLNQQLKRHGFLGPYVQNNQLLTFAVTEKRTIDEMQSLIEVIQ